MNNLQQAIELITEDKLERVMSYLKWCEIDRLKNGKVRQFVSPDNEYVALIPLTDEFSDYYQVMAGTLKSIASFEKRSVESLINRLLNPSYDILKWRIENGHTLNGKIPFLSMAGMVEKIKEVLAATYLDVLNPTKFHTRIYTKDVTNSLSEYSFGQTEIGSYILNILCPLGGYQYATFVPTEGEIPIKRRVNMRLLTSIGNIQNDLEKKNQNKVDEDVDRGVYSVNFLDSLVNVYDETKETEMSIAVDWCKNVEFASEFQLSSVKLKPVFLEKVSSIADKYRPRKEENCQKTYYGKIDNIMAEPCVENREYVQIRMVTIDGEDNKKTNIWAKLDYNFSQEVYRAFDNGLTVKLSGISKTIGNKIWIEEGKLDVLND